MPDLREPVSQVTGRYTGLWKESGKARITGVFVLHVSVPHDTKESASGYDAIPAIPQREVSGKRKSLRVGEVESSSSSCEPEARRRDMGGPEVAEKKGQEKTIECA